MRKGALKLMAQKLKYKASAKYDAEHTQRVYIKLNKKTDKDILEKLNSTGNKQGYIKNLIRADIKRAN